MTTLKIPRRNRDEPRIYGPKDERLAVLLASGVTRQKSAQEVGYSLRTVYARLGEPEFARLVDDYRRRMLDQAVGKLTASLGKSIEFLEAQRDDPELPPAIRQRAAIEVLDQAVKVSNHADIDRRMAEIERRLDHAER